MKKLLLKHPIITGTLMLSFTNVVSRIIGFFYRVYLSRTFGAEQLGILQLTGPVSSMAFALTGAGMQTAISKCVSAATDKKQARYYLYHALAFVLIFSSLCSIFLYYHADWIAVHFLSEMRTASILRVLAFSFPLSAAHACINGYFLGKGETVLTSLNQFIEQIARVGTVYVCCSSFLATGDIPSLAFTAWGTLVGEIAALSVTALAVSFQKKAADSPVSSTKRSKDPHLLFSLLKMALPLNANRLAVNFLTSIESIRIPMMLELYGMQADTALSTYGILSGMALPVLFFPTSFTFALSSMILPSISKAQSQKDKEQIHAITINAACLVIFIGLFCGMAFFMFSDFIGTYLFQEPLAGIYIRTLCLLCPFLYVNHIFSSILQGLGHPLTIFFINVTSLCIRLGFVFFLIPTLGIQGYLIGLLISQLYSNIVYFCQVKKVT